MINIDWRKQSWIMFVLRRLFCFAKNLFVPVMNHHINLNNATFLSNDNSIWPFTDNSSISLSLLTSKPNLPNTFESDLPHSCSLIGRSAGYEKVGSCGHFKVCQWRGLSNCAVEVIPCSHWCSDESSATLLSIDCQRNEKGFSSGWVVDIFAMLAWK